MLLGTLETSVGLHVPETEARHSLRTSDLEETVFEATQGALRAGLPALKVSSTLLGKWGEALK